MSHFAEARILVVDDEPDVLEAYRQVFSNLLDPSADELAMLGDTLFEQASPTLPARTMVAGVDLYRQGEEALQHIDARQLEKCRYPVAFIDMRMPPGMNGLETAKRLRQLSPDINIVVVTGYSDYPPQQIASEVGSTDRFFYLVKPFNPDELLQLAATLVNRWKSERGAAAALLESEGKTRELQRQVDELRSQAKKAPRWHATDIPDEIAGVSLPALVPRSSQATLEAAFREGRAASGRRHGLAYCPYSALKESELFSAWVAGYRSLNNES